MGDSRGRPHRVAYGDPDKRHRLKEKAYCHAALLETNNGILVHNPITLDTFIPLPPPTPYPGRHTTLLSHLVQKRGKATLQVSIR